MPDRPPYAPRHLNHEAQREWRRVVRVLMELGLYSELDYAALAMYCQAWGRWVQVERALAGQDLILTGSEGGFYQNPMLHVANKAWEQLRKVLPEFGLSPSSRSRLEIKGPKEMGLMELLDLVAEGENDVAEGENEVD